MVDVDRSAFPLAPSTVTDAEFRRLTQQVSSIYRVATDLRPLGGEPEAPLPVILSDQVEKAVDGTERLTLIVPHTFETAAAATVGRSIWHREGDDVQSWRIATVRRERRPRPLIYIEAEGPRYDLRNAGPVRSGELIDFDLRVPLSEWLARVIDGMPSAWDYSTTGLPDEAILFGTGGDDRLALLERLAREAERELLVTETATALTISMPEKRGSRTPVRITDADALRGWAHNVDGRDRVTHVMPVLAGGSLMPHYQHLDVTYAHGVEIHVAQDLWTGDRDDWDGVYVSVNKSAAGAREIDRVDRSTRSDSVTRIRTKVGLSPLPSSSSELHLFAGASNQDRLLHVPSNQTPRRVEVLSMDDPGGDNLLENPFLSDGVTGGTPDGWELVGSPTVTEETVDWNFGGAGAKVVADEGDGIEQTRSDAEGGSAFNMGAVAWILVTAGKVRVQGIQTASGTDTLFPADDQAGAGVAQVTGRWLRVSVPGQPGIVGGGIRVTAFDGAATFIVDAAMPFVGDVPTRPVVGRESWRMLEAGARRMRQIRRENVPSVESAIIDFRRLQGARIYDPGDDVRIVDQQLGIAIDARMDRVLYRPSVKGSTQVTLSHKPRDMDVLLRPAVTRRSPGAQLVLGAAPVTDEEGMPPPDGQPGMESRWAIHDDETLASGQMPSDSWTFGQHGSRSGVLWEAHPLTPTDDNPYLFQATRGTEGTERTGDAVSEDWEVALIDAPGGLSDDQEDLLDRVDDVIDDESRIRDRVVRYDGVTSLGFMSGLISGTGRDGDEIALPVVGSAVPLVRVVPTLAVIHPGQSVIQQPPAIPDPLTLATPTSPRRSEFELLHDPPRNRVEFRGRVKIDLINRRILYRAYRIAAGTTTRVYYDTLESPGRRDTADGGAPFLGASWRELQGVSSPDGTDAELALNVWHPFWARFGGNLSGGDTVGMEFANTVSITHASTAQHVALDEVVVGETGPTRMVIGANGLSRSGFTVYSKLLLNRSPLTERERSFAAISDTGATREHTLSYSPHLGEMVMELVAEGVGDIFHGPRVIVTAIDVKDGSDAWREVARRATRHVGGVPVTLDVPFIDTAIRLGDRVRIRIVSQDFADGTTPSRNADTEVSGTLRYRYTVGDTTDILYAMTPADADRVVWLSNHGEAA